jgi:DNA repair exonuclease SbcCD ATPase subunit
LKIYTRFQLIKFKKISYANFLSSGSYFTEIKLDQNDVTMIVGKNGAGKSTVLDALSFVLFGRPFRNINKAQLINSVNKKKTRVEVEFSVGTDEFLVIRGIKPNLFEIYKNSQLIPEDSKVGDYQHYLETFILRCNYKAFCQVVVLGSASYVPFLDLPTPQRRAIVENILDLEIFSVMNMNLKKQAVETNDIISDLRRKKDMILDKIELFESEIQKQEQNNEQKNKAWQDEIDQKIIEITEIQAGLEDVDELNVCHNAFMLKVTEKEKEINQLENEIRLLKKESELNVKTIEFYHSNDNCPTCRQSIDALFKATSVEDLEEVNRKADRKIDYAIKSIGVMSEYVAGVNTDIKKTREKMDQWKTQNNQIMVMQGQISLLKKSIENNQSITVDVEKLEKIKNELCRLNKELDVNQDKKDTENILLRLLKDDGIKAKIINQYVEVINEIVNTFLFEMDFMCQFMLDSEFNETIKSRYRDDFTFASFSEGEKLRITLAILFTWREIAKRRNSISTNILFFDEILDSSLDSEGIDNFIKIIKHLTKDVNTFIISHNSKCIDSVDNIIEFKKVKGFSHIVFLDNK